MGHKPDKQRCKVIGLMGQCERKAGHKGLHENAGDGWPGPAKPEPKLPSRKFIHSVVMAKSAELTGKAKLPCDCGKEAGERSDHHRDCQQAYLQPSIAAKQRAEAKARIERDYPPCDQCKGAGQLPDANGQFVNGKWCKACRGTGHVKVKQSKKKIDIQGWEEHGRQYYGMVVRLISGGEGCVDILDRVSSTREIEGVIHHREKIEHARSFYVRDLLEEGNPELVALLHTAATGASWLERLVLRFDKKRQDKEYTK